MDGLAHIVNSMQGVKIMVVGDLMLDRFVYGDVDRISPEGPIPVLSVKSEETMLGGAGNVLANLCALGAKPVIFAVTGCDAAGEKVVALAAEKGADTSGILRDDTRPTTLKTRYLARHQQLLRSDLEKTHPLDEALEKSMIAAIQSMLPTIQAVILSDYGKGVLTKRLLEIVIQLAGSAGIPILVDPKGHDYTIYRGADIVTPNRQELTLATGSSALQNDDDIVEAGLKIIRGCGIATVVATRSEDGMSIVRAKEMPVHLKTEAREVFDVSGAGDTVIATLAAALAAGSDLERGARLANIAAGIAVSKVGTAAVRSEEILTLLDQGAPGSRLKIKSAQDAGVQIRQWKAKGLKTGFTNGCFDILHKGHVRYLEEARLRCDRLIVALNHDDSVRLLKGPTRPVNDEEARAHVLAALACVDMVVLFGARGQGEDNTPCALIDSLRPDIFFKGGDYKEDQLPEAGIVRSYGGSVAIMGLQDGYSTTNIIKKSASA